MTQDTLELFFPPPEDPPSAPTDPAGNDEDGSLPLDRYAERAYLAYAMSVVKSRALPQVTTKVNIIIEVEVQNRS